MIQLIITNNYGLAWTEAEKQHQSQNQRLWKEIKRLNTNNRWGDKIGESDLIIIEDNFFVIFYNKIGLTHLIDTGDKIPNIIQALKAVEDDYGPLSILPQGYSL